MFNYSLKTKIIIGLVFLLMVAGVAVLVYFNFSRARDLKMVSEAKILATAMERYYDKFQSYPQIQKISVGNIRILSDQGLNQDGEMVYFRKTSSFLDSGTLVSDGVNYAITFDLKNSWETWGIDAWGGGSCRIATNVILKCGSK